jgi:hypothetical protein
VGGRGVGVRSRVGVAGAAVAVGGIIGAVGEGGTGAVVAVGTTARAVAVARAIARDDWRFMLMSPAVMLHAAIARATRPMPRRTRTVLPWRWNQFIGGTSAAPAAALFLLRHYRLGPAPSSLPLTELPGC